jgi:phage-related minor tail protein
MLNDMKGLFAMLETFATSTFSASIEAAEADSKAAEAAARATAAQVKKLKRQKKAVEQIMAKYRASLAKADAAREKWQREANKRMKKMPKIPPFPMGGVTEAFVPPAAARRAG